MTEKQRLNYWLIWIAFLLIAVGQIIYNIVFTNYVSSCIFSQYDLVDAQLPNSAKIAKYIFGVCESLAFVIIIYTIRIMAIKDLALTIAYGLFFFLTTANFCNSLLGVYYSLLGVKYSFGYAVSATILATIEYYRLRGKHT